MVVTSQTSTTKQAPNKYLLKEGKLTNAKSGLLKPHTESIHQGNDVGAGHYILQSNKNVTSLNFLHVLEETMTVLSTKL